MGEFDIIRDFFAPLTKGVEGAFDLKDDVAEIDKGPFIVTSDAILCGVHFLPKDPLDLVARKLLRVNLSDLAAKGAKPHGYLLTCVWPQGISHEQIELFTSGLKEDQSTYKLSLYGGDTVAHRTKTGPMTFSATVFGAPPRHGAPRRCGAQVGDDLYVTGTIGDAGLGLRALQKKATFTTVDRASLAARYHLPEPRLSMGGAIAGLANATIDVSDGLVADAGHLASASGVRAEIDAVAMPRSAAASAWLAKQSNRWKALAELATMGDDYEILFAAAPSMRRSVAVAAKAARTEVSRIGVLTKGEGVALKDESGREISFGQAGYSHL